MKTFIAGVGRATLFKGDEIFANCTTLADSSITIGVTAEDIRGGEGNVLYGQYFHDASFSLKLTDIMFSLEYLAANCGATWARKGDVFATETVTSNSSKQVELEYAPVAVQTGGSAYLYYKEASDVNAEYSKILATSKTVTMPAENTTYCVMYRYTNTCADQIIISSQFIPDVVHAVLTVALYAGDSCSIGENTNKVGEITIDIPRFQLSGANELSMTAVRLVEL